MGSKCIADAQRHIIRVGVEIVSGVHSVAQIPKDAPGFIQQILKLTHRKRLQRRLSPFFQIGGVKVARIAGTAVVRGFRVVDLFSDISLYFAPKFGLNNLAAIFAAAIVYVRICAGLGGIEALERADDVAVSIPLAPSVSGNNKCFHIGFSLNFLRHQARACVSVLERVAGG